MITCKEDKYLINIYFLLQGKYFLSIYIYNISCPGGVSAPHLHLQDAEDRAGSPPQRVRAALRQPGAPPQHSQISR